MNSSRHLVYVSDVVPGPGHGGGIIIDRHLRRLAADGWSVTVVAPFGSAPAAGPWREIRLPARRWWWPPFRPDQPAVAVLRTWAWQRELARAGLAPADAVVTICWGAMSWLAAAVAATKPCPLIALVHDWWGETDDRTAALSGHRVCASATAVLAVSVEMQAALAAECGRPIGLLYPLPAARTLPWAAWRDDYRNPTVAHVGSLHLHHMDFLAALAAKLVPLGGRLLLVCPRQNPVAIALQARCANLQHRDFFPDNAEALAWVAARASAIAVMYPAATGPSGGPLTGFPSRLVEFSQLGLPVLLAAPPGNPVRTWAGRRTWHGQCAPGDDDALDRWVRELAEAASWASLAAETRAAAETDFDPGQLQASFRAALPA